MKWKYVAVTVFLNSGWVQTHYFKYQNTDVIMDWLQKKFPGCSHSNQHLPVEEAKKLMALGATFEEVA